MYLLKVFIYYNYYSELQERRRIRSEATVGLRKNKQEQELMKRRNVGEVLNGKE